MKDDLAFFLFPLLLLPKRHICCALTWMKHGNEGLSECSFSDLFYGVLYSMAGAYILLTAPVLVSFGAIL